MYYIKLKNDFSIIDKITHREEKIFFGVRQPNNTHLGFLYNYTDVESSENYFSIIPERFRKDFTLLSLHIVLSRFEELPPHIDVGVLCCINFYVRADSVKTQFYSIQNESNETIPWSNVLGLTFNLDKLSKAESFDACNGEVYLLDTSTPHSVTARNGFADRLVLSIQSEKFTFDEVKEMLEETNSI
jgi:hypothetical protein